jgi:hypothetical protein
LVVPEIPSGSKRCVRGNGIASGGANLVAKRDALSLPIGPLPDLLDRFIGATASFPSEVSCQRKVEMSGFLPDRNVRFHGFLQG